MGKWMVVITLMGILCMSGCEKEGDVMQNALDFRASVLNAAVCTYEGNITANYGDRMYTCTAQCQYSPSELTAVMTLTAPESISGIVATTTSDSGVVEFEDVAVEFGELGNGNVAPMELSQLVGDAWTKGWIESVSQEGEDWLYTYRLGYDEEELVIYTRLTPQKIPYAVEIYENDTCILEVDIGDFSIS